MPNAWITKLKQCAREYQQDKRQPSMSPSEKKAQRAFRRNRLKEKRRS